MPSRRAQYALRAVAGKLRMPAREAGAAVAPSDIRPLEALSAFRPSAPRSGANGMNPAPKRPGISFGRHV